MITDMDYSILDFIHKSLSSPFMDTIMKFFTHIGEFGIIWVIICAVLLISPKTRYIGVVALVALFICLVLNDFILKNLIQRNRPFVSIGKAIIIKEPSSFSFPSGHTASSFAAAFVFFRYLKKSYAYITLALAALVSFSRLYLYVHFPSDILAGIIFAYFYSFLAILLFDQYKKRQELKLTGKISS